MPTTNRNSLDRLEHSIIEAEAMYEAARASGNTDECARLSSILDNKYKRRRELGEAVLADEEREAAKMVDAIRAQETDRLLYNEAVSHGLVEEAKIFARPGGQYVKGGRRANAPFIERVRWEVSGKPTASLAARYARLTKSIGRLERDLETARMEADIVFAELTSHNNNGGRGRW